MRERLARLAAALVTLLIVALAAAFAARQNGMGRPSVDEEPRPLAESPSAALPSAVDPEQVIRGRAVFEAQPCRRCHSVAGDGNPRSPLDGVGRSLSFDALRSWVTGNVDGLSPSIARAKSPFAEMPPQDLEALVAFLASLR